MPTYQQVIGTFTRPFYTIPEGIRTFVTQYVYTPEGEVNTAFVYVLSALLVALGLGVLVSLLGYFCKKRYEK